MKKIIRLENEKTYNKLLLLDKFSAAPPTCRKTGRYRAAEASAVEKIKVIN